MSKSYIHHTSAGGARSFTSLRIPAVYGTGFFKTEWNYNTPEPLCQQVFKTFSGIIFHMCNNAVDDMCA